MGPERAETARLALKVAGWIGLADPSVTTVPMPAAARSRSQCRRLAGLQRVNKQIEKLSDARFQPSHMRVERDNRHVLRRDAWKSAFESTGRDVVTHQAEGKQGDPKTAERRIAERFGAIKAEPDTPLRANPLAVFVSQIPALM